jgi:hypothetical protein
LMTCLCLNLEFEFSVALCNDDNRFYSLALSSNLSFVSHVLIYIASYFVFYV